MKNSVLTVLILSFTLLLSAQSSKRGFKSLEKLDYQKAKEHFEKNLLVNSGDIASNLGYSLILADENSGFFDIVSAWKFAVIVQEGQNNLTQDELEVIGEYFLNTEVRRTSRPVKQKVKIALQAIEDRLIQYIREENDLEAVYRVLEEYPNFKYHDNVIHIRNQFEYRKCEKMNTLEGFQEFIQTFQGAAQIPKAIVRVEKLAFDAAQKTNTVEAYTHYITAYPESELVPSAIRLRNAAAFANAKSIHSIAAFDAFIRQYPGSLEVAQAKTLRQDLVYQQAKRIQSIEAYNDFISQYPEGRYYIDIFNLKSLELGKKALAEIGLPGTKVNWARGFDNNTRIDYAAGIAQLSDGSFVLAATTQADSMGYTDAWIIQLSTTGTMLWNKYIGQDYNDSVIGLVTTAADDIIVLGYTQVVKNDSTRLGWMFKLDKDGKRIWNKSLGMSEILAFEIDSDDHILLSTRNYDTPDTVSMPYRIQSFNTEGRLIWERSYVSHGDFVDISTLASNTLLTGTHWMVLLDNKHYIIWDSFLPDEQTASKSALLNATRAVVGTESSANLNYSVYEGALPVWKKSYAKTDSTHQIIDMGFYSLQNEIISVESDSTGCVVRKHSSTGMPSGTMVLNPSYTIKQVYINQATGSLLLIAESRHDVYVFSLNGL